MGAVLKRKWMEAETAMFFSTTTVYIAIILLYLILIAEIAIDAEEEKHIAAVQKAMEERGMLDHTIIHGVFVGPARSGKNSLMERLLNRMPSAVSPSTGIAESVVQVKVIQKSTTLAANVEELIWSVMDYDDEAIKLMLINSDSQKIHIPFLQNDHEEDTNSLSSIPESLVTSDQSIDVEYDRGKNDNAAATDSDSDSEWFDAVISPHQTSDLVDKPVAKSSVQKRYQLPDSYVSPIEIVKIALQNKGKHGLKALQQHFQKTWSLYLTNTGGQMEFQEVLPLLVSGPSIFFFTFRLDRDINQHYVIEYELLDGTKAEPYTSTLSIKEGFLQTLATIAAMGTYIYKGLQKNTVPLRPKVFAVATHKDKLDRGTADELIAQIDQELQEAIKGTSHYESLVEFSSASQLIFTVNNFSESDSNFKAIRSAVERVVIREEFHMTSPVHWLIFSLVLRKLKQYVVPYDQCLEVARQCGLSEGEVDEALHFIHSKMGLIRYFPCEDVKHLVVIHPQLLFDKVTELIVDTFTFEKAGKYSMSEFKQKGIFSLSEFEKITSRSDYSIIRPFQFAKLLEHLRIAAPFQMNRERKYFFPCVLAHTKETAVQKLMLTATPIPQLIITFRCGYCPKGIAGALIKYLMANEMQSCYSWEIYTDKIYRNQVSFHIGPIDTIVVRITPTYLEFVCIPNNKFRNREQECPLSEICSEIRKAVDAGIKQVTSDINYINAEHSFTFRCECKSDHPGELKYNKGLPYAISCSKTNKIYPLSPQHKYWHVTQPQVQGHNETISNGASKNFDSMQSNSIRLRDDHHSVLLKQLIKHAAAWREIGTCLGFIQGQLDNIQTIQSPNVPVRWLSIMLAQWLQWAPGDGRGSTSFATLDELKSALRKAGFGATAHDLGV